MQQRRGARRTHCSRCAAGCRRLRGSCAAVCAAPLWCLAILTCVCAVVLFAMHWETEPASSQPGSRQHCSLMCCTWAPDFLQEAKAIGDEFLQLEKYVNLNYMGFHKVGSCCQARLAHDLLAVGCRACHTHIFALSRCTQRFNPSVPPMCRS